jgi:hypothetical protein
MCSRSYSSWNRGKTSVIIASWQRPLWCLCAEALQTVICPIPGIASGLARCEEVVKSSQDLSVCNDVGPWPISHLNDETYDPNMTFVI